MNRLAVVFLLLSPLIASAESEKADLILIHGQGALANANTHVIDLKGRTATPGLIDTYPTAADLDDRNIYTVPTAEIRDMKCLMTLIDGQVVYQSTNH
jgi:predicted amidohydrolase YtcJ